MLYLLCESLNYTDLEMTFQPSIKIYKVTEKSLNLITCVCANLGYVSSKISHFNCQRVAVYKINKGAFIAQEIPTP